MSGTNVTYRAAAGTRKLIGCCCRTAILLICLCVLKEMNIKVEVKLKMCCCILNEKFNNDSSLCLML